MCGIFAVISEAGAIKPDLLRSSLQLIAHRGPDGHGIKELSGENWSAALGHRRLAIFDLSNAAAQPMKDRKDRWLTFNGEIFNWPELRSELRAAGYTFHSDSDTEVLLAAYDKWGEDCVNHFSGFWAFAIVDPREKRVFVSRDRFGIKPLHWYSKNGTNIFCSEIKPIFNYLEQRPKLNESQLARSLVYGVCHDSDQTIYRDIIEVLPGRNVTIDLESKKTEIHQYWDLSKVEQRPYTDAQALERFSELVENAACINLRSNRNVAMTLSGGIDSSVVAVAASRVSDTQVHAYTTHYPDNPQIDESAYAIQVAKHVGLRHTLVEPDELDLESAESRLTWHQELPYAGFSLLASWAVVRQIKTDDVPVLLCGQGGDEVFLGYERYFAPRIMSEWARPWKLIQEFAGAVKNSRMNAFQVAGMVPYFMLSHVKRGRYLNESQSVLSPKFLGKLSGTPGTLPFSLKKLQQQQIGGEQLRRLLRYEDRITSAYGMESRPVLLDHKLVEFGYSLGWNHKIRGGWTKYVMRRYLEAAGLPEIAWRTHKLGYPSPEHVWLDQLLAKADWTRLQGIVKPGLRTEDIPVRKRMALYNALSTAQQLDWDVEA